MSTQFFFFSGWIVVAAIMLFLWLVQRQTKNAGVLGPEERLTREESLRSHTIDAAFVSGDDARIGSIEVGKLADLAVLSDDILTCSTEQVKEIEVVQTVVGGRTVYGR